MNLREYRMYCRFCDKMVPTSHGNHRYVIDIDNPTFLQCRQCSQTYSITGTFCCPKSNDALIGPTYATSVVTYRFGDQIVEQGEDGIVYVRHYNGVITAVRRGLLVGFA